MKLINIRSQIQSVAKAWHAQYIKTGVTCIGGADTVYAKLLALNLDTCLASDVEAAIGNDSWACPKPCHECGAYCDVVVQVGEEPDYESATACLCVACCKKALEMFP